ncbi:3'-5' exonuclease [Anaerotruncus colihominis]|uniref:DNA 3'-5' helicase n=1 Tax=Anaerotruncus colihominis TaxID=169435 RepID=A0A845SZJ1_9FIRM|nr:3'-5' exonuclease [Anaerotruncus colihominis]MCR2026788.1 UvrD-helicase domain-containing protein [Anaerotruncus colihominis]NDO37701.1 AAA family ATPase [Anaerotruncus colihominis]
MAAILPGSAPAPAPSMARALHAPNEQQRAVIGDTAHSILLLAGAGTGKTDTLARRVANLIVSGAAAPEEILCLTFTNRACREMTERIETVAGETARNVAVHTVHGFCARMLRETPAARTDLGRDFTVCDAADALEIVRIVVERTIGREIDGRNAQILLDFIGLVKDAMLEDPARSHAEAAAAVFVSRREQLERICVDEQRRYDEKFFRFLAKYGASVARLYDQTLLENNTLDFSDLLIRAAALLRDRQTAQLWTGRFRFAHVDEAQDVSLAEYSLLSRLCGGAVTLFCGDFNQTIYGWRGSDPTALAARFEADFHPVRLEFSINYRSSEQLLAVGQNILKAAFGRGDGGHFSVSSPQCTDIAVRAFDTPEAEAAWILESIESLGLTDYTRVAVIARSNWACSELCELLCQGAHAARSPVRFMLADELRLFSRAEVKDALACIALLANPRDGAALLRLLRRHTAGVGEATARALTALPRTDSGALPCDLADLRTHRSGDFFTGLLEAFCEGRVVVFDVESTGADVYTDDIIQIAAVRLSPGGEAARFERFLRPSRPVGASERVHGFSDAFLAENGGEPRGALEDFLSFSEGCVLVGHNVTFDLTITTQNLARAGSMRTLSNAWYDTLDLSRRYLKELPNHKLSTVSAALGAAHDPSHNAMDDILATADVLSALIKQYVAPYETARRAAYEKLLPRLEPFARLLADIHAKAAALPAPEAARLACRMFGLGEAFAAEPARLANLELFFDAAGDYTDRTQPPAQQLASLLELAALSPGALDRMRKTANKVAVITAHQSKGCEFDYVFLPMMQEGVFPTWQAMRSGAFDEEARVFYVSVTRARKKLFVSWARGRRGRGPAEPSRFLAMLG